MNRNNLCLRVWLQGEVRWCAAKVLFNSGKQRWTVSTTSEPMTANLLGQKISWTGERLSWFHLGSDSCWCPRFYSLSSLALPPDPLGSLVLLWHIAEPFLFTETSKSHLFIVNLLQTSEVKCLYARPDDNCNFSKEGGQNWLQDRT